MKYVFPWVMMGVLLLCPRPLFAQRDFTDVRIKTTHVAGQVYMLEGSGGNIGVSIGDDGALIIDDQFAPLSDKILAAIERIGGDAPKFVINTHWHGDHTGGNENFGRRATIIAHTNVRKRLSTGQFMKAFNRTVEPSPKGALPVITFDESVAIHFNDEEIKVIHFPKGHTDGDSVIFFPKSNVVHMGDHFFNGRFPFVDLGSGGSVQGLIQNIETIMAETDRNTKIIPGHGRLATAKDLKDYYRMLVQTTNIIHQKMKDGKGLEQIQKEGLPPVWTSWGGDFISTEKWIEIVYMSFLKS